MAIKITEIEGINFDFDSREFNLTVTGKEYEYNNKGLDASMLSFNFPDFVGNTTAASLFDKDLQRMCRLHSLIGTLLIPAALILISNCNFRKELQILPSHGHSVYKMKSLY